MYHVRVVFFLLLLSLSDNKTRNSERMTRLVETLRIGESPSICPFLKNNVDEDPKWPSPIVVQEQTGMRTFSYFIYTTTNGFVNRKTICILLMYMKIFFTLFLLYFSLNYIDFSVKSKLIFSLFQTVKVSLSILLFQK